MKQNKLFLGLATLFAAAFTFTACSSDDAESQSVQQDRTIRLTSSEERGSTRATSDPQSDTSLSTNSSLGVIAINSSSATLTNGDNEPYSVDGSGNLNPTTTANKMTWPASGNVSFYAYAPYAAGATYDSANSFSVQTDQTGTGYLASDLVVAKSENVAETSSAVSLGFKHLMSKINITIGKASGATVDLTHAKVSIINTNTATSFKLNAAETNEDPILGETSTPADITLFSGDGNAEPSTVVGVMVPQTIAAGSGLVKIQTYPGNAANRTLIAKVDAATTFASGQQYSFTVTINNPTAPVTYITLKSGSANLVAWYDNNLGAATKEYSIGDYILNDGSLLRASDPDFATKKTNVIAVIFSNNVCAYDANLGYDGYAMGLATLGGKNWGNTKTWLGTEKEISTWANALTDISGIEKTTAILNSDTYTNLTEVEADNTYKVNVLANLSNYSLSKNESATNLSDWFVPSIGQMILLLNGLGKAGLDNNTPFRDGNSSSVGYSTTQVKDGETAPTAEVMLAVQANINKYVTDAGKSAFGNVEYATVTESNKTSNSNFWHVTFNATTGYSIGQNISKTPSDKNRTTNVIPCIAFKVK